MLYYNVQQQRLFSHKTMTQIKTQASIETNVLREFTPARHRHRGCISAALRKAEVACKEQGIRLTALRRRVFELVWASHEPVKAYDILQVLQRDQPRAAPPTVYRALDFLQLQGLVHKIESLNAYVGCGAPGHPESGVFLICRSCAEIAELDDPALNSMIVKLAAQLDFATEDKVMEIKGYCARCSGRG